MLERSSLLSRNYIRRAFTTLGKILEAEPAISIGEHLRRGRHSEPGEPFVKYVTYWRALNDGSGGGPATSLLSGCVHDRQGCDLQSMPVGQVLKWKKAQGKQLSAPETVMPMVATPFDLKH